jgi:hypothetical protein
VAWLDAFRLLKQGQTFESILLRDDLPLVANGDRLSPSLVERASGVLAAHLPNHIADGKKSRLIFVLPNATQSLGRFLAVSLLLADFVNRQEGKGPLLTGDLLLVTQHIRKCLGLLRDVSLRRYSEKLSITQFWPIEVLSQYSPPPDATPRVFIANPGWSSVLRDRQAFGSVVIDATHPRTADHLDDLLKQPSVASAPTQILVIPPWENERIRALSEPGRSLNLVWAWDPAAVEAVEQLVMAKPKSPASAPTHRFIWLTDDPEVENLLVELHTLLVGAMKAGNGKMPGAVLGAWGTYHKLRQLAVPLIALEEERKAAYHTLTIQERIQELDSQPPEARGAVGSYLDARWPSVISNLKTLYDLLLHRKEPSKFYTLAAVVAEFLENSLPSDVLRIVAPSAHEGNMLTTLLGELVEGWPDALQSGVISLTTNKEEPRLIAEGALQQTVILGFRGSQTRYLDVYPGVPLHVVAYRYEAEVDEKIQQRIHASIESLQENGPRTIILKQLQLPMPPHTEAMEPSNGAPISKRPLMQRRLEVQHHLQQRRFLDEDAVEPLSLEKIVGQNWFEEIVVPNRIDGKDDRERRQIEYCEVTVTSGARYCFPAGRLVDVFRPATEQKERIPAGDLEPGMLIVVLVDDPYEDIFQRMLESIREQRDIASQMALALWEHAKPTALTKFNGSRTNLFRHLAAHGLSVDYQAVVGWFRPGEEEILAPQGREDFELLARASGLYSEPTRIIATFNCIEQERRVRRTCGRTLSALLAHLAAGENYELALKSADAIGTAVEHVAAAVSLQEVEAVRNLGKRGFSPAVEER